MILVVVLWVCAGYFITQTVLQADDPDYAGARMLVSAAFTGAAIYATWDLL